MFFWSQCPIAVMVEVFAGLAYAKPTGVTASENPIKIASMVRSNATVCTVSLTSRMGEFP